MGQTVEEEPPERTHPPVQQDSGWHDLSRVREGWAAIEAQETRLLRQMTVEESLQQLIALHRTFEAQLQETEPLFRAERIAYLEELQRRLLKLEKRKRQ